MAQDVCLVKHIIVKVCCFSTVIFLMNPEETYCLCSSVHNYYILRVNSLNIAYLWPYSILRITYQSDHFLKELFSVLAYNISSKSLYAQLLFHFIREFISTLHACLLPYGESLSFLAAWLDHFWRSYCPFWYGILHPKVHTFNSSYILKGNSLKLWTASVV